MTRNLDHGIKAAPLNTLLTWLKDVGIAQENFHFVFVVPSYLAGSFKMQTIRNTAACEVVTQTSGVSTVDQYVGALDVVVGNRSRR
ncbi:hypothetical protein P3T76_005762 [Phytophthora citrophthora]|uniref:Uncharacterized protein n=1 Tax=Phytophthora citrophthora TaxID=4793 RepID=A0AAD9GRA2_9STRA|nr:hypothetical protein P3T76_005762 [Phytophthora citrophthora]